MPAVTGSASLVVTKLDRFARSAEDTIQIIKNLFKQGVKIHVSNMGLVENPPTGRLILTIMSGFAEFERDMIVQRTQEDKALQCSVKILERAS
jgi:DNA invertase Pin-like site-specific DNA recombinase